MNIEKWFEISGNYQDGLALYQKLPTFTNLNYKSLKNESFSNFIRLKYELKRGLSLGYNPSLDPEVVEELITEAIQKDDSELSKVIVAESKKQTFAKETMAMYPMELHPVYRQRISDFYLACELKFKLNNLKRKQEKEALDIILQLEALWNKIDRAWMILEHWKSNGRIMPFSTSVDFTKLKPIELFKQKDLIESRISKREKTLNKIAEALNDDPENRLKANQYNTKKEALEQLKIDLETIKNLLK